MGDGNKLKEILDARNMSVRELARNTGIGRTTLYYIINNDTKLRFDFALRIANELEIDVNDICSSVPFSGDMKQDEIYPTLPDALGGKLDASRVKTYLMNSLYPLMFMYGKNSMPDVDHLLTDFYRLDDGARKDIITMMESLLKNHLDKDRDKEIKEIKGWSKIM